MLHRIGSGRSAASGWARSLALLTLLLSVAAAQPTVIDAVVGPASLDPREIVAFNGAYFFSADHPTSGRELWVTDGTPGGTSLVLDIAGGPASSNPTELTVAGGVLYFVADDGVHGAELWRTLDGTAGTTALVADLQTGAPGSVPTELTAFDGQVYFSADDGTAPTSVGRELFTSDGFSISLVKNINPDIAGFFTFSSNPSDLLVWNGALHFVAEESGSGGAGRELWRTDGTAVGTELLVDALPGSMGVFSSPLSSSPSGLTAFGGHLYFAADRAGDGSNREVARTDGTLGHLELLSEIHPSGSAEPHGFTVAGGRLFFAADGGPLLGEELYAHDGSSLALVHDLVTGAGSSSPTSLTALGGVVVFSATDAAGREPWVSDGSAVGTLRLADLQAAGDSNPDGFTAVDGNCDTEILFAADGALGRALYLTDGTAAGTRVLSGYGSDPSDFLDIGTQVLYRAVAPGLGAELHLAELDPIIDDDLPVPDVASLPTLTAECTLTATAPTATDACAGALTATTTDPLTYTGEGMHTITWTYDDGHGNTVTQTQMVVIDDVTAPVPDLAVLPDVVGECSATLSTVPTATDNCGETIMGTTSDPLTLSTQGTAMVTWSFDDGRGNVSTQVQTIVVMDQTPPVPDVATLPALQFACSGTVSTVPTATDNCVGAINGTTTDPLTYGIPGVYSITWVYDDGLGNQSMQTQSVTITDAGPPTISCPPNHTQPNDVGLCGAVVNYALPTFSDDCPGATLTLIAGLAPGSVFPVGTTMVTYEVMDLAGQTDSCSFTVTITDNEPPVMTASADITVVAAGGMCSQVVTYPAPTIMDNCPGASFVLGAGLASGSAFPVGSTVVLFNGMDASGNTATCSFTVTVLDQEAPVLTCSPSLQRPATAGTCGAAVSYTLPTATDNCPAPVITRLAGLASGAVFPVGTTTVTYEASRDASGNVDVCSFDVTVLDVEAPVVSGPASSTVPNDAGQCSAVVNYSLPTVSDNCPGASVALIAGLAPGAVFPLGTTTVTYEGTDAAGNTSQHSFDITVVDAEAPMIDCGPAVVVNIAAGSCSATVAYSDPVVSDNCPGVTFQRLSGPVSGSVLMAGTHTVVFEAMDAAGNTSSCPLTLNVVDATPPVLSCPSDYTIQAPKGAVSVLLDLSGPFAVTATDECTVSPTIVCTPASGTELLPGVHTVNCTATDASGNQSTCTFDVKVVADFSAPVRYAVGSNPIDVAIGDFGTGAMASPSPFLGDGLPDVATANAGGNLTILFNRGAGVLGNRVDLPMPLLAGDVPVAIAAGRFGNSGQEGLAVAIGNTIHGFSKVLVYENTGTAMVLLASVELFSVNVTGIEVAQVDGTGGPDILVTMQGTPPFISPVIPGDVELILNPTAATLLSYPLLLPSLRALDLVAVELDGDGDLDLAVLDAESQGVLLLDNDGTANFSSAGTVSLGGDRPIDIVAGDFDADGLANDVVVLSSVGGGLVATGSSVTALVNGELAPIDPLNFVVERETNGLNFATALALGDINDDTLRPSLAGPGNFPGDPALRAAQDVVVIYEQANTVAQFREYDPSTPLSGPLFASQSSSVDSGGPTAVRLADLLDDAFPVALDDLILVHRASSEVSVRLGVGRALGDQLGQGCAGPANPVPHIEMTQPAVAGESALLTVEGAPAFSVVTIAVSLQAYRTPFGPGCDIFVAGSIFFLDGVPTDALGRAQIGFPASVDLLDRSLIFQAAWADPTSPASSAAVTPGLHVRIGE